MDYSYSSLNTMLLDSSHNSDTKNALFYSTREYEAVKNIFDPREIPSVIQTQLSSRVLLCMNSLIAAFNCDTDIRTDALKIAFGEYNSTRIKFEAEIEKYICNNAMDNIEPINIICTNTFHHRCSAHSTVFECNAVRDDYLNRRIAANNDAHTSVQAEFWNAHMNRSHFEIIILKSLRNVTSCRNLISESRIAMIMFNNSLARRKQYITNVRRFPMLHTPMSPATRSVRNRILSAQILSTANAIYDAASTSSPDELQIVIETLTARAAHAAASVGVAINEF